MNFAYHASKLNFWLTPVRTNYFVSSIFVNAGAKVHHVPV